MLVLQAHHSGKAGFSFDAIELDGKLTGGGLWIRIVEALLQIRDFGVEAIEALAGIAPVDVAQRHDVLACEIDQIGAAHAADAHTSDVEHVAGRSEATTHHVTGNDGHCCTSSGDVGQKFAARQIVFLAHGLLPLLCGHYRAVPRTLRMVS